MSTGDTPWDEMPENLLHLPGLDPALPDELIDRILCGQPVEAGTAAPGGLALAELVTTLRRAGSSRLSCAVRRGQPRRTGGR